MPSCDRNRTHNPNSASPTPALAIGRFTTHATDGSVCSASAGRDRDGQVLEFERAVERDKAEITEWLLDPQHPAVWHATLTTLLNRAPNDREVRRARSAMMRVPPISTILANQTPAGYWGRPDGFYRSKYRGTAWQVIFLSQLVADPSDERIHKACEFLFDRSQNRSTGSFSVSSNRGTRPYPCLTGNLVRALLHFGYGKDERWQRAVEWLLANQHEDGGWSHGEPDGHGCFQGSIKPLLALTAIPRARRSKAVQEAIGRAADFFLQHCLFRRDHHGFDVAKSSHLRLRFPHGWQTDVLEMLDGVTAAGVVDDLRLADALAVVLSKRDPAGRWAIEDTFRTPGTTPMWCSIEAKGRPSKWVTLRALRVLRRIGERRATRLAEHGAPAKSGGPAPERRPDEKR